MDAGTTTPRSRRSHTNLNHLSLAPLSQAATVADDDGQQTEIYRPSSYIQGRSAPTTPRILSRNSSTHRLGGKAAQLAGEGGPISKSKSTTLLQPPPHGVRGAAAAKRNAKSAVRLSADHGEWLFRAGTAISTEARESKGQSWLVSRESSTSLVAQSDEDSDYTSVVLRAMEAPQELEPVAESPYLSRATSRRTSRPVSQVSSRADVRTLRGADDYFGTLTQTISGPDFVDAEEESEDEKEYSQQEEAEVTQLAKDGRGFGIGGLVDKMVEWTLFNVEEHGREDDDEEDEEHDDTRNRKVRSEDSRITGHLSEHTKKPQGEQDGEGGGWKDAAWLLSVASKVLL